MELQQIMADTPKNLGQMIKMHRVMQGLTMEQLAEISQVSRVAISRIEKGNPNTRISTILPVLAALDISIPYKVVAHEN